VIKRSLKPFSFLFCCLHTARHGQGNAGHRMLTKAQGRGRCLAACSHMTICSSGCLPGKNLTHKFHIKTNRGFIHRVCVVLLISDRLQCEAYELYVCDLSGSFGSLLFLQQRKLLLSAHSRQSPTIYRNKISRIKGLGVEKFLSVLKIGGR